MGREVWGTYSVVDHKAPNAFLADLLFYDRLVLPVPIRGEEGQWAKAGWAPEKQSPLIERLQRHDRVQTVGWKFGTWEAEQAAAAARSTRVDVEAQAVGETSRGAFQYTRTRLLANVPRKVRAVATVPTFTDPAELMQTAVAPMAPGQTVAAISLRFIAPSGDGTDYEVALEAALDATGDARHKKARAAFWAWQRDFFGDDVIADQETLDQAVQEIADLTADLERTTQWGNVKTATQYLFLAGSVTIGALGGPLTPVAIAGAALGVGKFVFDRIDAHLSPKPVPAAALFAGAHRPNALLDWL